MREIFEQHQNKFFIYLSELKKWNEKFNLTGLKTDEEITEKLFLDSLSILPLFSTPRFASLLSTPCILDVGTGAGFPGIPLKIVKPEIKLTLLESNKKKCNFLRHITEMLGFKDVEVVLGRAEELGQSQNFREKFDVVVSRAVAKLPILCELCIPFVKVGGIFITQKGSDIEDELKSSEEAIKILGGQLKEVKRYEGGNIILIEKVFTTPDKFPRRLGIPQKHPI